MNFSIPLVAGIKQVCLLFVLSFETGVRYTFSDNLDGTNPIGEYENNITLKHGSLSIMIGMSLLDSL